LTLAEASELPVAGEDDMAFTIRAARRQMHLLVGSVHLNRAEATPRTTIWSWTESKRIELQREINLLRTLLRRTAAT